MIRSFRINAFSGKDLNLEAFLCICSSTFSACVEHGATKYFDLQNFK